MQKTHVKIKGLSEYSFSKPTKDKTPKTEHAEVQVALNKVYCTGNIGNGFKLQDWSGTYDVPDGNLYIPNNQIKACILAAVSVSKMKIEKSMKRAVELIKPLLFVQPDVIFLKPEKTMKDIYVIEKPMVVDQGKLRWNKYARISPPWELEFDLIYGEALEEKFLLEALENAGLLCSIGGERPDRGKFEVGWFDFC